MYFVGFQGIWDSPPSHVLLRGPVETTRKGEDYLSFPEGESRPVAIVGRGIGRHEQVPGSDDRHLNFPKDVACDSNGRVYVADHLNNRVQVFDSDGNLLKTMKVDRPHLVQVHATRGDVYVAHQAWRQGRSVPRITRFTPFPTLSEATHWDDVPAALMTLDSYSPRPRLWISGETVARHGLDITKTSAVFQLRVYEDRDDRLVLLSDFEQEAREAAGGDYIQWPGGRGHKVVCDPVRERLYWNGYLFDLVTGRLLGRSSWDRYRPSEIAFDKRGYMHIHRSGSAPKGIVRVYPELRNSHAVDHPCREVSYDYGEVFEGYAGALPTPATDTQHYSWGLGVNMRGDIAVVNHIGYVPKFQEEATESLALSQKQDQAAGVWRFDTFAEWMRRLDQMKRRGEDLFYIRPQPGIPLYGATIWTYEATGRVRHQAGVIVGPRVNGVQIDEDGFVYFTTARRRYLGDKPFLWERGGNFGGPPYIPQNRTPFTGTYLKSPPQNVLFRVKRASIPMATPPARPPDLAHPAEGGFGGYLGEAGHVWADGVMWMYAGATGIVAEHCDCPQMRASLDWYKRSFVPEVYRHSIGILDTNGNVITHVGRYGNFDSDGRPGSRVPPGGDGVALIRGVYVSTTDNYFVIEDWNQRLIVVRLHNHAEEAVPIVTGVGGQPS